MAHRPDRQSLINEITELQEQQSKTQQEIALHACTPEQSMRVFHPRFNRMASLMHRLAELDEADNNQL